jgi:hypothetical protein
LLFLQNSKKASRKRAAIDRRRRRNIEKPELGLIYVSYRDILTHMEKTQVYLRKDELDALRKAAARSGRSVASLVREAVRAAVLLPSGAPAAGPVAIWDGKPRRSSIEHDSIYDEP